MFARDTRVARSLASIPDVYQAIAGQWVYCWGEPSNFKGEREFTADGKWFNLRKDELGAFHRLGGPSDSGTFVVSRGANSFAFHIEMSAFGGGSLGTSLSFATTPDTMFNGPGTYVRPPAPK